MVIKQAAVGALRVATRMYLRFAPWSAGRADAYRLFSRYVAWRHHHEKVTTRFGDEMDLTLPDLVSAVICATGQWEPNVTQYILDNLKPGETFIDVGANIGYYTLLASRIVGPAGAVFSIEASKSIFERLQRNVSLNDCGNVTCINAAASDSTGELSIYLAGHENLGHSTTVKSLATREGMLFEQKVRADTVEALVGGAILRQARLIKIDVEGAELAVLKPLIGMLSEFNEGTEFLMELSPAFCPGGQSDVDAVYESFRAAGYGAFKIPNGYSPEFFVSRPMSAGLEKLSAPPQVQADLLMSRRVAPG